MLHQNERFIEQGSGAERYLPAKVWSHEIRAEAASLFEKGYGFKTAAYELKIPAWTVRDWKRKWKAGTFQTKHSTHVYRYPEEVKAKARALRKAGYTLDEIEQKLKISRSTIYVWVKKKTPRRRPADSAQQNEI